MRPVDTKFKVTLGYHEKANFDPNYVHRGIDYGCPAGTTVRAAAAGQVVHAGYGGMGKAFGLHIVVKSAGIYCIYAHLSSESVFVGQGVTAGQILGKSGATGNVTGAHLHYGEFTSYWYTADRRPQFVPAETSQSGVTTAPAVAVTTENVIYVVTADPTLNGREKPVSGAVLDTAKKGAFITSVGYTAKQSDGQVWVKNTEGRFWSKEFLRPLEAWFDLCLWPLAGYDVVYGADHFAELEDDIVAEIKRIGAVVYGLTEVPGARVASFKAKLATAGYKIVITSDGRTIVAKADVKTGRTKKVTLAEKGPANDDKQVVMAELWPEADGDSIVLVVGHLEYRKGDAYDDTRVTQAKQEKAAGIEFAKECATSYSRLFFADDENSGSRVLKEAYEPSPVFRDAFDLTNKKTNVSYDTICGWSGEVVKGSRSDKIKGYSTRRFMSARVSTVTAAKKLSDHLPTIVVVGK